MIGAIIVLYHPDLSLLDRLVGSVVEQVEKIFVIDNTPEPTADVSLFFDQYQGSISYLPLGDNKGIATAQNVGIRASMDAGHSHVLLLDQDSALPADMVRKLLDAESELLRQGKQVAAVGPLFHDEKNGRLCCAVQHSWVHVRWIAVNTTVDDPSPTDCLNASGSLIRTSIFERFGLMLDELFIDSVDIEWCMRCKYGGFGSYIVPNVTMTHNIGDTAIRILGRDITLHGHQRHRYIIRNKAYLLRLRTMGIRWRIVNALGIPKYVLLYSWFSDRPGRSLVRLLRDLFNGLRGKTGRLEEK
ncbi:MAG: glycosyltransferase family 2 protein [Acidobacteriaceae bacterium]